MHWIAVVLVIAFVVFALRDLWAAYEALAHEPRRPGRAAMELLFFALAVLMVLWLTGVIP